MEFDFLKLDIEGSLGTLTFNDPDNLNAMTPAMLNSIDHALDHIEDPENKIRCLIITGAGRGFCAGANVASDGGSESDVAKGCEASNRQTDAGAGLECMDHSLIRRLRGLE